MCRPTRTRIGPGARPSDIADAAATAPGAVGNAKKKRVALRVDLDASSRPHVSRTIAAMLGERLGVSFGPEVVQELR